MSQKQKALRRAELCLAEVDSLQDATPSYKAIGRMFVQTPMPKIKQQLHELMAQTKVEIQQAQQQEIKVTKQTAQYKQSIDELLGASPAEADQTQAAEQRTSAPQPAIAN